MYRYFTFFVLTAFMLVLAGCRQKPNVANIPEGEFWKRQGIQNVLKPWHKNARDTADQAFHTYLNRKWKPYNGQEKYPGMISRHIFSYSVGYLLSGDESYLQQASRLADYIIEHGWDEKYGGWYNSLNRQGHVKDSAKDGFFQPYAIAGLSMYYFVTHDREALDYIRRSHCIMQEHAWDSIYGGYYRGLNRNLSPKNTGKDFSPQLAPASGYLIYLYLATRDSQYLTQMKKIMQVATHKMSPPDSPWILERFDRQWNPARSARHDSLALNTGHQAEVVWMLLRLYELTEKDDYFSQAMQLQKPLYQYGFEQKKGVWYHRTGYQNPSLHSSSSPWWVQAYGNMLSLYLYRQTEEQQFLKAFRRGADYWNRHFIDDAHGGAFLSVKLDGTPLKASKAVRSKTSYHSLEHALLNYIYTNLWIKEKPVTLHFKIPEARTGEKLYPLPVEDATAQILRAEINGEPRHDLNARKGFISLPAGKDMKVKLVVAPGRKN